MKLQEVASYSAPLLTYQSFVNWTLAVYLRFLMHKNILIIVLISSHVTAAVIEIQSQAFDFRMQQKRQFTLKEKTNQ